MRIPRTRGAVSGLLLMVLGAWGAIIPFVGPLFSYAIGPTSSWTYTTGRLWLSILPGAVAFVGGFLLMTSANRPTAAFGAWLGILAGIWFAIGQSVSLLWSHGTSAAGAPTGSTSLRAAEEIGWFYGLGAAILGLAAFALGRLAVKSVRDERLAQGEREADRRPRERGRDADTGSAAPRSRRFARAGDDERETPATHGPQPDADRGLHEQETAVNAPAADRGRGPAEQDTAVDPPAGARGHDGGEPRRR